MEQIQVQFKGIQKYGIEPLFSLRWGFAYRGRRNKYGMWDKSGTYIKGLKHIDQTVAWCQTKENLTVAYIEVKNLKTREVKKIVACDGHNFVNFEWSAITPLPMPGKVEIKVAGEIYGLVLVTRDERITVLRNGKVEVRKRTESEQTLQYSGFGK